MARPSEDLTHAQRCFLAACTLDVAVRKPGNVSLASAGHGMQAALFIASAQAAMAPLFAPDRRVGARVEAAVAATLAVAGCNTNLGILLLCAPLARAIELYPQAVGQGPAALQFALEAVLGELNLADTQATYRAIAQAHPGGLGEAPEEDVHDQPRMGLRAAMALAADRDSIARQYRDGYRELFGLGLPPLAGLGGQVATLDLQTAPKPWMAAAVQRVYLGFLATLPDSHIVRKHGLAVAQTVMRSAQGWQARAEAGEALDADAGFAAWDVSLKSAALNPGTSADFTVAALFIAALVAPAPALS